MTLLKPGTCTKDDITSIAMATSKPIAVVSLTNSTDRKSRLLQACCHGNSEGVVSVLCEEETEEDRTALVNCKNSELNSTPLHEACRHGNHKCIPVLLKYKADPLIWDHSGYAPIHIAARGNHRQAVEVLLQRRGCRVDEVSQYEETPLHIACLGGHTELAKCLCEQFQADLTREDLQGSTVLHYGCASDSAELLLWLLSLPEAKALMDKPNKRGHTPLYHACSLGCTHSLAALIRHNVSLHPPSSQPHTPSHSQVAHQLGNMRCHGIVEGTATPPSLPVPTSDSFSRQDSHLSDNLRQSHSSAFFHPLRSNSSGSRGSRQSLFSTASGLQRRGSLLGTSRPVTLRVHRSMSLRRGSGEDPVRTYLPSRGSATRLSQCLDRQASRSLDQLLYDSTAYEPPPDIIFTLPIERSVLTAKNQRFFSQEHDLKLRVSKDYWTAENKSHVLNICLCAAMHYSQTFPQGYTVVSPICFLSCRSKGPCQVNLTLPHAVDLPHGEDVSRLVVLSTATAKVDADPESPFFSPSERVLAPLEGVNLKFEGSKGSKVKFETDLRHPSLFAVAVREGPGSIPLPLRCCLYVLYPELERDMPMVSGFDVETYIGMNVKTVATAVGSWSERHGHKLEEKHFSMSGEQVVVTAVLGNQPEDWEVERRGDGKFHYMQVSLTQHTDQDTYSHQLPYPPRERFFIEPKAARGAVKCRVCVANSIAELCHILVIPFSPKREATPDPVFQPPSSTAHRQSLPLHSSPSPPPPSSAPSLPLPSPSPPPSSIPTPHRSPLLYVRLPNGTQQSESQV